MIVCLPFGSFKRAKELAVLRDRADLKRTSAEVYGDDRKTTLINNTLGIIGEMLHAHYFGIAFGKIRVDRPDGDGGWDFSHDSNFVDVKYADVQRDAACGLLVKEAHFPPRCDAYFLWRIASAGEVVSYGLPWTQERRRSWGCCVGWIHAERFKKWCRKYDYRPRGTHGRMVKSDQLEPIVNWRRD